MATYELINDEETTKLANERVGKLLEESSKEIMGLFESRLIEAKRETLEKLNDKVYKEAGGRASFAEHDGAVPVANIEAEFMGAFDDVLEDELSKLSQSK